MTLTSLTLLVCSSLLNVSLKSNKKKHKEVNRSTPLSQSWLHCRTRNWCWNDQFELAKKSTNGRRRKQPSFHNGCCKSLGKPPSQSFYLQILCHKFSKNICIIAHLAFVLAQQTISWNLTKKKITSLTWPCAKEHQRVKETSLSMVTTRCEHVTFVMNLCETSYNNDQV